MIRSNVRDDDDDGRRSVHHSPRYNQIHSLVHTLVHIHLTLLLDHLDTPDHLDTLDQLDIGRNLQNMRSKVIQTAVGPGAPLTLQSSLQEIQSENLFNRYLEIILHQRTIASGHSPKSYPFLFSKLRAP